MALASAVPQESATAVTHERYYLACDFISGTGYGVQAVLFSVCAFYLWRQRKVRPIYAFLLAYTTLLFLASTLVQVAQAHLTELAFVDNKNFPGGPWAYHQNSLGGVTNLLNVCARLTLLLPSNVFMTWRCWVVWVSAGRRVACLVISLPVLMIIVSLITDTFLFISYTHPDSHIAHVGGSHGFIWSNVYCSLVFSTGIIVTIFILIRLIIHRRRIRASLSHAHGGVGYLSVMTIIVESFAVFSIVGALCVIATGVGSPASLPFSAATISLQQICEYLIILRVARGEAWKEDTITTAIHFRAREVELEISMSDSQIDVNRQGADTKPEQMREERSHA
ncbi:hypothetical protein BD779DRAFT_77469 [Infundibulicybe gibba]|nr:hypothetical protein BD779DRAFT_77469 [Infundibulicybe gibba]